MARWSVVSLLIKYCGSSFEIHDEVPQQDAQKENDLMLALSNSWKESQAQGSAYVVKCPACGAEVPLGRLTGMLGLVCRHCDAYNEPQARTCVSCGNVDVIFVVCANERDAKASKEAITVASFMSLL